MRFAMADPIYAIWHRVRSPFRLPKGCHRCTDWEPFDVDKAGCRACGQLHHCKDGSDCPGVIEDDHQACEITGCWVRLRNFQQSYADTMSCCFSTTPHIVPKPWIEAEQIARSLHFLVFSDTAKRCMTRELQRVYEKANTAFARVAKLYKLERQPPDMLGMFAQTRFVLGSLRVPNRLATQSAFDSLSETCTHALLTFTTRFKHVLMPYVLPTKLDHCVIGLIYLLRTGIVMFDTLQVVPRIPVLRRLLPMETCLKAHFHIPCKIITEVENITKTALKTLDRRKLKIVLNG